MAKSKGNGVIIIGLVATGAYFLYDRLKSDLAQITAKVSKVKIKTSLKNIVDLRTLNMSLTLDITNPTKNSLQIESIKAQAVYEGIKVSDIDVANPFTIEPNLVTPVVVDFKISTHQVAEKLLNAILNKTPLSPIQIIGKIYSAGVSVPVSQTLNISL